VVRRLVVHGPAADFRFAAGKSLKAGAGFPPYTGGSGSSSTTAKWTAPIFVVLPASYVFDRASGRERAAAPGQREKVKLLFIGDIVGSPGRQIVADRLGRILCKTRQESDLVIANG